MVFECKNIKTMQAVCYAYIVFYRTFTYQVFTTLLISYILTHTYFLHISYPFILLKNHFIVEINAL
jgi:hypothetical protein